MTEQMPMYVWYYRPWFSDRFAINLVGVPLVNPYGHPVTALAPTECCWLVPGTDWEDD